MKSIYYNGSIITMTEKNKEDSIIKMPEAVAVQNGKIVGVGDFATLKKQLGNRTNIIDLNGKCLMPSFIDPHSHIAMNGQMGMSARLNDCESFQDIIDTLRKYISDKKINNNTAVIGFGYDHNFLKEQAQPDKRVLDQVSKDIPILILHVSAHLACVNSKALELAGISSETPNPEGGMIGRLGDRGEPSGYLEEAGMALVQQTIYQRVKPDFLSMMREMQEDYVKNGITTAQDGASTAKDLAILKFMSLLGQLKVDIVSYPLMTSDGEKLLHKNKKRVRRYVKHLKIGGYKLVLDGSPQGRSAWMSEPYLGGDKDYCGYPWMGDDQVEKYVSIAISERQQLLAHCNGDAASEQFLRAYEKAIERAGEKDDLRPVMIHCQTVRNDQLNRMSRLKMIASIFIGHVYYWGDIHMKNFGNSRGNHISPAKDALERGVIVNFHQDTPVTRPDMMHSVWCAVNRESRKGEIIGENQKVDVYEALKAITINGAYQYFEEDSKGSIEVGKRADLVILDRSPLEISKDDIKNIVVVETIKDGKIVYKR